MILNDKEAATRLNSPGNLINKLKTRESRTSAMNLFGMNKKNEQSSSDIKIEAKKEETRQLVLAAPAIQPQNQEQPERLDDILDNSDSKVKLALAHDTALKLLNSSVAMLAEKLDDVKVDKLPAVIAAASRTVESIRKERIESERNNKEREVHYHFYTPEQRKIDSYEVIEASPV